MQRAYDSRSPQPPFTHPRMSVTADIVERKDALPGMTDDDFPSAQADGAHAAQGNLGERQGFLELRIAHWAHRVGYGCAHFNRDPSPEVLNLSAASDLDFRLEDRDRLTDDPDRFDAAFLDFQLHVHAPGAVQLVALYPAE